MNAVVESASSLPVQRKDRAALALSILGALLLYFGLELWEFEYESGLFLLPFAACIGLVCAIVAALQWQYEQARRTFVDRAALAIASLALVAPGTVFFFVAWGWKGAFLCLPYMLVFLLPLRARSHGWPLALGLLAVLGGPAAYALLENSLRFDALILCLLTSQLVALLGIALGSTLFAKGMKMSVRLGYGLALDVLVIGGPLVWLILHMFSED